MDDQREVIRFLGDGASHGMPGVQVEQITTHISIIFLIGERAYKLKRAVRFSYLDYSTPALREKFCRAELDLNRRTAPALYLQVRAVTRRADGTLTFDGSGTVVDWVLEMRRFAQSDVFDQLAEQHKLTPALMRELTDAIVAFHAAAETVPERGGRTGIAQAITGNIANLLQASPADDRARIGELGAASYKLTQHGIAGRRERRLDADDHWFLISRASRHRRHGDNAERQ